MKKIFYILASAIVALGAVACDNQDLDNIAPGVGGDSLSFSAVIDNTKTDLSGTATVWVKDDVVVFAGYEQYEFVYDGTANFTCTTDGVTAALGDKGNLTAWYNKAGIDSTKGTAGAQLKAEGCSFTAPNPSFKFEVQNAFLKVTTKGQFKDDFVLTGAGMFSEGDAFSIAGEVTDKYIAIKPTDAETTLTYSIGGVAQKVAKIKFEAGKIYNLGELTADVLENWGVVGNHQGWNTANKAALYKVPASVNTYSRGNVALNGTFKFHYGATKTTIIEHPAVTTGEEGDWYLQPNANWKKDNARFAIYFFGNGETWVDMKDENGDGIYVANNPTDGKNYPSMIFCRMSSSATANNWNNKWNQTSDLTKPTNGNNCYKVTEGTWDKGGGTWSVHTPEVKEAWTEEVEEKVEIYAGIQSDNKFETGKWFTTYSNNEGGDITATGNYDLYLHIGEQQDWGFTIDWAVQTHGGALDFGEY